MFDDNKKRRPEIVLGFLLATIFWIAVLGWATSYAPNQQQKDACYQAAIKSGRGTEECKTFWEKVTSDPVATFTLVLAFSTVGLWAATIGIYFAGERQFKLSRQAIAVTRNIGEAQVRAYVSITSASIYFLGDDAAPTIEIVATNSGQSPALNFVWTPEIHYLPENAPEIVSEVEEGWNLRPGIDIHSTSNSKTMFFVHDFPLVEKITTDGGTPDKMGVSVTLYYAWDDVFDKTSVDAASFASVAEVGDAASNQRQMHPLNTSKWRCQLYPIAKGQSWSGIAVQAPQTNTEGQTEGTSGPQAAG